MPSLKKKTWYQMIKLKYTVWNSKKNKLNKQKNTWSAVTRCCHQQLKYFTDIKNYALICIFSTFYEDFMTYPCNFTAKKHWPRWFLAKTRCACCTLKRTITRLPEKNMYCKNLYLVFFLLWFIGFFLSLS